MKRRLVLAAFYLVLAAVNVSNAVRIERNAWWIGFMWIGATLLVIAAILNIALYRMDRQDAAQNRRLAELEEQFRKEWLERP